MTRLLILGSLCAALCFCSGKSSPEDGSDQDGDAAPPDVQADETPPPDGQDPAADDTTVADPDAQDDTPPPDTVEEDVGEDGEGPPPGGQIVADHSVVDRYDDIPAEYLDQVKSMWFNLMGESHSSGYRIGVQLLADMDARFPVVVTTGGEPEPPRTDALRVSGLRRTEYSSWASGAGEAIWYTNDDGKTQIRNHITYCETNGLPITALGFGWCWDMTWHNGPGGDPDPVYQVHWAGSSEGGPDDDQRWGLDADDTALTGNRINMDSYLTATQEYDDFSAAGGYGVRVIFTTGPVDGYAGESGYQRHVKHEYLRAYVRADGDRILFDYADILAWSDGGEENLQTWTDLGGTDQPYQMIHPDNMLDLDGGYEEDGDHIGERGALRLGKAVWWLLARMAGWEG